MKVIATSDAHPDKSTAGFARFLDVQNAWMKAATHARKVKADLFVFAGDLCEPDSPHLIRCVCLAMRVVAAAGCASLFVDGNHDIVEDGRGTSSLDPVAHLPGCTVSKFPEVLEYGDKLVATFPYVSQERHYDPAEELARMVADHGRDVDLVVSHLMLDGIGPGSEADMHRGRDVFLPIDEVKRQWSRAKILNGHYHNRQTFRGVEVISSLVNFTRADRLARPCFLELDV